MKTFDNFDKIYPAAVVEAMAGEALSVLEQASKGGSITNTNLVWSGDVDKALAIIRDALAAQQGGRDDG